MKAAANQDELRAQKFVFIGKKFSFHHFRENFQSESIVK